MAEISLGADPHAIGIISPDVDLSLPSIVSSDVLRPTTDTADLSEALFVFPTTEHQETTGEVYEAPPVHRVEHPAGYLSRGDWLVLDKYGHPRPPAHLLYDADSQ
jgi:hypothetical protein